MNAGHNMNDGHDNYHPTILKAKQLLFDTLKEGPGTASDLSVAMGKKRKTVWVLADNYARRGLLVHRNGIFYLPEHSL